VAGLNVTDAQLREAAERADAGNRLAFPELFDSAADEPVQAKPASPKEEIDHETAAKVGRELLAAHQAIYNAAKALPLKPQIDLHLGLNGLINEIDRIAGELAKRWAD
jgi:hypothetical protein